MAWPTAPVPTGSLDSVLDAPFDARPDLLDATIKINQIIAERANIADAVHAHIISDVTGLQSAIDAKQSSNVRLTNFAAVNGTGFVKKTGTNAYALDTGSYQPLDAALTSIAGATTASDTLHYWTAADTIGVATLTSAARALLDDPTTGNMRTTLGLAIGTDVQGWSSNLQSVSGGNMGVTWSGTPAFTGGFTANAASAIAVSTGDALRVTNTGTGNCLVVEDSANPDATPFVIDATGTSVLGYSASLPSGVGTSTEILQGHSTSAIPTVINTVWKNSGPGAGVSVAHSRGATIGTHAALVSGDACGYYRFYGSDGAAFQEAGRVQCAVDLTPSSGIVPGKVQIFSTDAGGVLREALRVDSSQNTTILGDLTASRVIKTQQTLTDAATIAWNLANGSNAVVTIAATGRTITPSNLVAGSICILKVIQGSGGSKTITTWNNVKWNGGTAPTLTTTAAHWDLFSFYSDGTNLCELSRNLNQS